jgi:hypothetical protein
MKTILLHDLIVSAENIRSRKRSQLNFQQKHLQRTEFRDLAYKGKIYLGSVKSEGKVNHPLQMLTLV